MRIPLVLLTLGCATFLPSCGKDAPAADLTPAPDPDPDPDPEPDPQPTVELGDPMPDLTAAELATFERGRVLFERRFKPSEGLGPMYNATSCKSCHSSPVSGGGSDLYRNFYVASYGSYPFLLDLPGLPSPVVPAFGSPSSATFTLEAGRVVIPQQFGPFAVQSEQRNGIPIFGTGMFEFVSDATILSHADPDDTDGDGISGRANNDGAGLGRFGTKAQANNIELFTRAPLFNQMGISTNPLQGSAGTVSLGHGALMQGSATPNAPTFDNDGVPDPELSPSDLGDLIAFSRFLAPPQPRPFNEAASRGQALFDTIGCAKCHLPELESSRGPVRAFTDLLLHDMGPGLAGEVSFGTPQMGANDPPTTEAEWRTAPLWGVASAGPWLHDGRASSLDEAILLHGGESQSIRDAYVGLSAQEREDILEFLRHL
ncbi:MAG: c-type cytochrome [Planctomycetes bacterium]|nr:c-type cytochrome [Planctomycetota bacterium]